MGTLLLGGGCPSKGTAHPTPKDVYKLLGVRGPTPKDVYTLLGVRGPTPKDLYKLLGVGLGDGQHQPTEIGPRAQL